MNLTDCLQFDPCAAAVQISAFKGFSFNAATATATTTTTEPRSVSPFAVDQHEQADPTDESSEEEVVEEIPSPELNEDGPRLICMHHPRQFGRVPKCKHIVFCKTF